MRRTSRPMMRQASWRRERRLVSALFIDQSTNIQAPRSREAPSSRFQQNHMPLEAGTHVRCRWTIGAWKLVLPWILDLGSWIFFSFSFQLPSCFLGYFGQCGVAAQLQRADVSGDGPAVGRLDSIAV